MIRLDATTVLLQWAVGGLLFLWVTCRHRQVGIGYGWLLRITYMVMLVSAFVVAFLTEVVIEREIIIMGVVAATTVPLLNSYIKRKEENKYLNPNLDLVAPILGIAALVVAALDAGGPPALAIARILVGAIFLGVVSDAMLLGHWYLVQPGLTRAPLLELVRLIGIIWPFELAVLLYPTGMLSVINGTIDDGYGGLLGWFWIACTIMTIILVFVTRAALKERQYSAVMAATGLLYLAILTGFGMDLVARATLA